MVFLKSFLVISCFLSVVFAGEEKAPSVPQIEGNKLTLSPDDNPDFIKTVQPEPDTGSILRLSARLAWNEDKSVKVYPALGGRVAQLHVKTGENVKEGQTLATLLSPDFSQARADAAKAEADFKLAQQSLKRQQELHQAGVVALKDLQQTQADYTKAQIEQQRTANRLKTLGINKDNSDAYHIRSPISGAVVERNINQGQEIKPETLTVPLFSISDPTSLWVIIDAHENQLGFLPPDAMIQLETPAYPSQVFPAKIVQAADFIDPNSRTIKVRALVENTKRLLKAEMFVTALINIPASKQWRVPSNAIFFDRGIYYILVQLDPRHYERRPIKALRSEKDFTILESGVSTNEKIVTEGGIHLINLFGAIKK
jgi:cobalt-zinc-cadmium efflux system membrane fusion protein